MLTSRGFGRVLGDLAEMGFDARWGVLGTKETGGPSVGERIWIVASKANEIDGETRVGIHKKNDRSQSLQGKDDHGRTFIEWWRMVPASRDGRVDTGLAYRVDRLEALGNGQVPAVAALAWEILQ
jgi:DNA (cytosine-5)-methyltransferase 1